MKGNDKRICDDRIGGKGGGNESRTFEECKRKNGLNSSYEDGVCDSLGTGQCGCDGVAEGDGKREHNARDRPSPMPLTSSSASSEGPVGAHSATDSITEFREWLLSLDAGNGALLCYEAKICQEFDSLTQLKISGLRVPQPVGSKVAHIDASFFDSIGVTRAGHQFLLARGIC